MIPDPKKFTIHLLPSMPSKAEIAEFQAVLKDRVDALLAKVDLDGADYQRRQRIGSGVCRSLQSGMREMGVEDGKVEYAIRGTGLDLTIRGTLKGFKFVTTATTQPAPEQPEFPTAYDTEE